MRHPPLLLAAWLSLAGGSACAAERAVERVPDSLPASFDLSNISQVVAPVMTDPGSVGAALGDKIASAGAAPGQAEAAAFVRSVIDPLESLSASPDPRGPELAGVARSVRRDAAARTAFLSSVRDSLSASRTLNSDALALKDKLDNYFIGRQPRAAASDVRGATAPTARPKEEPDELYRAVAPPADPRWFLKLTRSLPKGQEVEKRVHTRYGDVEVRVVFRPQHNDVFFTLRDTPATGTSLRLDLGPDGRPSGLASIQDPDRVFAGLFRDWGLPEVAAAIGSPEESAYRRRLEGLERYEAVTRELNKAMADPSRSLLLTEGDPAPTADDGVFVNQNEFQAEPRGVPLATAGVDTCSALIIDDASSGRHFLAHVDAGASPEEIAGMIRASKLDLAKARIIVMPGLTPAGTVQAIYAALKLVHKDTSVRFLHFNGVGFPSVGIAEGRLFIPRVDYSRKSRAKIH